MVDEHRIASRRRLLKAGKISFGGGGAFDCTVRNLSETGAALEVISPVGMIVNLANWSDETLTKLSPHEPEPTGVIVSLESRH